MLITVSTFLIGLLFGLFYGELFLKKQKSLLLSSQTSLFAEVLKDKPIRFIFSLVVSSFVRLLLFFCFIVLCFVKYQLSLPILLLGFFASFWGRILFGVSNQGNNQKT